MSTKVGVRTLTTAAIGAAATLMALVGLRAFTAEAVGADESTFVPMTPCRLLDTRPESQVGERSARLGPGDTYSLQVTGEQGECNIPDTATAVSLNLTGVLPSEATFLSAFPDGAANPGTSVVNMVAGQVAVPNKIDVKLGPTGKLAVFNRFGNIHVVGDVLGYYRHDGLADLESRILELEAGSGTDTSVLDRLAAVEADNAALVARVADLEADVSELTAKTASMSTQTVDGQPTVRFTGVNVQVVDGTGETHGPVNGRGNLIVGYSENFSDERTGSHNLVVGVAHSYTGYSGVVVGANNTLAAGGDLRCWKRQHCKRHLRLCVGWFRQHRQRKLRLGLWR